MGAGALLLNVLVILSVADLSLPKMLNGRQKCQVVDLYSDLSCTHTHLMGLLLIHLKSRLCLLAFYCPEGEGRRAVSSVTKEIEVFCSLFYFSEFTKNKRQKLSGKNGIGSAKDSLSHTDIRHKSILL